MTRVSVIDKVEFKVTVLAEEEDKVEKLLRGVTPAKRKVYFFDTRDLDLDKKGLYLRARVTEGDEDDSTVKLRPSRFPVLKHWREAGKCRIELDVVGVKEVPSVKLDGDPDPGEVEQVAKRKLPLRKLFGDAQEALIARKLPDGVELDDLEVLGPVAALKWELPDETFAHELAVERWSLPDKTHFVELSFKVDPADADDARKDFHAFLDHHGIGRKGDPNPKTKRVLELFASRLPSR